MTKKIRFGVVGTNFITDWVIAGAREDERFELAAAAIHHAPANDGKARVDTQNNHSSPFPPGTNTTPSILY